MEIQASKKRISLQLMLLLHTMELIKPLLNQEYRNVKKQKYLNMKLFKMEVREKKIVGLKNI